MTIKYTIWYRQPGQWFPRRVKNVIGSVAEEKFWYFLCDDDRCMAISIYSEVWFPKERNAAIQAEQSKRAGFPVVRA